jgi:rhodanese-related sulfurtransferase
MQVSQLLEFVANHWYLFLALALILGLLIHNLIIGDRGSVGPLEATELINHKEAVVVDVRPAADYAKGHIINAINVPMNGFKNQMTALAKHKDKPVIVSCRSGSQSSVAAAHLRKQGFADVHNLKGGVLAWEAASLPLTKKKR